MAHCSIYRPRKDERLSCPWVAGYIPPGVEPGHVTHPSTNRARRRVTSLIRQTPLPLRHAAAVRVEEWRAMKVSVDYKQELSKCWDKRPWRNKFDNLSICAYTINKYVPGDGRISTHADPTSIRRAIFHERRIISIGRIGHARFVRFFGFWESKVPQNVRFPALDADEPPYKMWRR